MKYRRYLSAAVVVSLLLLFSCAHAPKSEQEPLTARERLELGALYEAKGEIDSALGQYREAISADRTDHDAYFAYANLNLMLGRYDRAKKAYRAAIGLRPKNGTYRNNLAWLYMEEKRYGKAVASVDKAIELDPARAYIYLDTLGVILTRMKNYEAALEKLEAAVASAPANRPSALIKIYGHMAELHRVDGNSRAEAEARRWIEALK